MSHLLVFIVLKSFDIGPNKPLSLYLVASKAKNMIFQIIYKNLEIIMGFIVAVLYANTALLLYFQSNFTSISWMIRRY